MRHRRKTRQGMALVMVLWVVAAMSLVVASISYMVRAEVRHTSALRDAAHARAAGRAAIVLVLQEIVATNQGRLDRPQTGTVMFEGVGIDVQAVPLNGLVDINRSSPALLSRVLESAAGMSSEAAQELATAIVEKRTTRGSGGGSALLDATEDLLEIPGVDYEVYARLAPLITANSGGDGKVNPYAAPEAMLLALAAGNSAAVTAFMTARATGTADLSGFDSAFLTTGGSTRLRLHAHLAKADGGVFVVSCDVSLVGRRVNAAPWNIQQCDYQTSSNGVNKP